VAIPYSLFFIPPGINPIHTFLEILPRDEVAPLSLSQYNLRIFTRNNHLLYHSVVFLCTNRTR